MIEIKINPSSGQPLLLESIEIFLASLINGTIYGSSTLIFEGILVLVSRSRRKG